MKAIKRISAKIWQYASLFLQIAIKKGNMVAFKATTTFNVHNHVPLSENY